VSGRSSKCGDRITRSYLLALVLHRLWQDGTTFRWTK
jgi:hypothetical protein